MKSVLNMVKGLFDNPELLVFDFVLVFLVIQFSVTLNPVLFSVCLGANLVLFFFFAD
jgi:hypothetical protein